jgi:mono/diheme cytochrome c family protein
MRRTGVVTAIVTATAAIAFSGFADAAQPASSQDISRGRYLVEIAGCNDCHTAGYAQSGGNVPETKWLTGDQLGWYGPWGTTYPPNLRLYMQTLTEAQWVRQAPTLQGRPPMPWYALHHMSAHDLAAIYRFVRYLGPAGKPAPQALPPGQVPPRPYVTFPQPPK